MNTFRTMAVSTVLATLAVAGCSSDSKSSPTTKAPAVSTAASTAGSTAPTTASTTASSASPGGAVLTISGFKFSELTVTAGQQITITNKDSAKHTVTADDKSFSVEVPGNGTATLTIATPGTYPIHCEIHSSMKGTITVG